jgi:hypothetical protein
MQQAMGKNKVFGMIIAVVIIGGGSFYAGMSYGAGHASAASGNGRFGATMNTAFGSGANGGAGFRGARQNGGFVGGDILSKDDKSITIKMRDGGSKIVFVSGTTEVMKAVSGSLADLSLGAQVTVMGTANQDGSVSAQSVQIRPSMPASMPGKQ